MNQQIATLESSGMITDCVEAWGSLLLLTANFHQEDCTDICAFVWRLCISYRFLYNIILSSVFIIPRYTNSIEDLGESCGSLLMIF